MDIARRGYDGLRRLPELPAANWHPWRRESKRRLAALKDTHKGERCFVVGNGPSLKNTDLSKLKNDFCIGMNRISSPPTNFVFARTFWCVSMTMVVEQSVEEFNNLQMPKFFAWRARKWLTMDP